MKTNSMYVDYAAKSGPVLRKNSPWFETKHAAKAADIAQTIALNLKRARLKADLSQRAAGEQIGVKSNMVSCWENGRFPISVVQLVKLLRIYGVSFTQILTGEGLPDFDAPFEPTNQSAPVLTTTKKTPKARECSDTCDTFEPSLMCPDCLAILRKVTA